MKLRDFPRSVVSKPVIFQPVLNFALKCLAVNFTAKELRNIRSYSLYDIDHMLWLHSYVFDIGYAMHFCNE